MSFRTSIAAAVLFAAATHAQSGVYTMNNTVYTVTQDTGEDVALASKHFEYPYLPYHADSGDSARGTQQGYNICNGTTLGDSSWCQTGFVNSVDDFCLWGSPVINETVADVEEEMVAFCTTPKYGTRVLPPGAIQGVQFIQTPDYVEVVGYIDQTKLNLQSTDTGGEEDPHGADERGNPLGSLLYSSAFGAGNSSEYKQVIEWSYFVGGGLFCFKACDPAGSRAAELCQHTYDRVGCAYNDPADYAAINGTFTSCQGDDQLPVGQYVTNGKTSTFYQPAESLGAISSIPYVASIPATSSCSTFTSSNLFTALAEYYSSVSPSSSSTTSTTTSAPTTTSSSTSSSAAAVTDSGSAAIAAAASETSTSGGTFVQVGTLGMTMALVAGLVTLFA